MVYKTLFAMLFLCASSLYSMQESAFCLAVIRGDEQAVHEAIELGNANLQQSVPPHPIAVSSGAIIEPHTPLQWATLQAQWNKNNKEIYKKYCNIQKLLQDAQNSTQ